MIFMKNFGKKYAFSLAEMLLAVLIISIAITLCFPAIITTYKRSATVVILKDVYNELNSAITNASINKGCAGDLICKDLLTNFASNLSSEDQINKSCIAEGGNCWNSKVYLDINKNSENIINYNERGNSFVDAKDRIYNIEITDISCNINESEDVSDKEVVPPNHKLKRVCGYITVDIDGNKNTNIFGVDVFKFVLTNARSNYLYPYGGKYHNQYWKTHNTCEPENGNYNGESCAGRIVDENWKIYYLDK